MGVPIVWKGQPWTDNCREWIYYNCLFDPVLLIQRLKLPQQIVVHDYFDVKAGSERGLFCPECKDAVMGRHPESIASDTIVVK